MTSDGEFLWRPIEPADAGNWSALMTAIQVADRGWEFLSEQDLLEEFDDPDCDFTRGSMGIFADGTMAGYGTLLSRPAADPVHEMRYWGGVHPAYRQRGLGDRLLRWAETAAVPLHQERYPDRPLSLSGFCLSHNAAAAALYAVRSSTRRADSWDEAGLTTALPEVTVSKLGEATPRSSRGVRLNVCAEDHGWRRFRGWSRDAGLTPAAACRPTWARWISDTAAVYEDVTLRCTARRAVRVHRTRPGRIGGRDQEDQNDVLNADDPSQPRLSATAGFQSVGVAGCRHGHPARQHGDQLRRLGWGLIRCARLPRQPTMCA